MTSTEHVVVQVDRTVAVATVTLNSPPVNSMQDTLLLELAERLQALDADLGVRSLILTGAGEKAFAAGANLPELAEILDDPAAIRRHTGLTRRVLDLIATSRMPVVAALQASAIGGGLELALACDFIVADADARLGLPEVGLGLMPGAGGTQRLTRRIGVAAAARLILAGELIGVEQAERLGIVSTVAPAGTAQTVAADIAARLAARPRLAVEAAKRAIRLGAEAPLSTGLDLERELFTELLGSADAREGVDAFVARREPRFRHR